MKSAVVVGGSNGIGLAISSLLLEKGVHVHVLDVVEPNIVHPNCAYHYCNLMDFQKDVFEQLAQDEENDMLIINRNYYFIILYFHIKDLLHLYFLKSFL